MKRFASITALLFLLSASTVFAAGTVTTPTRGNGLITEHSTWDRRLIRIIKWPWESTSGTASISGGLVKDQRGKILKFWAHSINSSADDNYKVAIQNEYGLDVLNGDGANMPRDESGEEGRITPIDDNGDRNFLWGDDIQFVGTLLNSAGDASGEFYLMFEAWE